MPRGSNPKKTEEWTSRLDRFEESSQTVAAFCRSEGVSVPSFYHWKKKLRPSRGPFQSVHVAPPVASIKEETVIQLAGGIHIQLGSNLPVVELIVKQLLAAALDTQSTGAKSC
jgi:hypothetical protein